MRFFKKQHYGGGVKPAHSKAFTLAEVLVTLGVLGVVAALTMPTLIDNHRDKVLVTQIKATYNLMLNAFDLYKQEHKCFDLFCLFKRNKTETEIADEFATMFSGSKVCDNSNKNESYCKSYPIKGQKPYKKDGKYDAPDSFSLKGRIVLKNGSYILIRNYAECKHQYTTIKRDDNGFVISSEEKTVDVCSTIYIDANGNKGPNQFGADIYRVSLKSDGLLDDPNNIKQVITTDKLDYVKYKLGEDVH